MKRILSFALAILLAVGFCCNAYAAAPSDSDIVLHRMGVQRLIK